MTIYRSASVILAQCHQLVIYPISLTQSVSATLSVPIWPPLLLCLWEVNTLSSFQTSLRMLSWGGTERSDCNGFCFLCDERVQCTQMQMLSWSVGSSDSRFKRQKYRQGIFSVLSVNLPLISPISPRISLGPTFGSSNLEKAVSKSA